MCEYCAPGCCFGRDHSPTRSLDVVGHPIPSAHLDGAPLPKMEPTIPELANPVELLDVPQGWRVGFHLYLVDLPGIRSAGSGDWSGLFNSFFWVDRKTGVGAVIATQLLPFFDDRMVETILGFEAAVYAELGATVS
jgi:methyl acetate hydrolase